MKKPDIFRKLHSLLTVLEHWRVYQMRKDGIEWRLYLQLAQPWLMSMRFQSIIDIGAHTGAWSRTVHAIFPKATIYAFEPLSDRFQACLRTMEGIGSFQAFNIAVGERNDTTSFYRNTYDVASSILPLTDPMRQGLPSMGEGQVVKVGLCRLDDWIRQNGLVISKPMLVKIDVQGYEDRVIAGGQQVLAVADVVVIETSFEELYTGQVLFQGIADALCKLGLWYSGSLDQFTSPIDGHVLQQDSIFVHR